MEGGRWEGDSEQSLEELRARSEMVRPAWRTRELVGVCQGGPGKSMEFAHDTKQEAVSGP